MAASAALAPSSAVWLEFGCALANGIPDGPADWRSTVRSFGAGSQAVALSASGLARRSCSDLLCNGIHCREGWRSRQTRFATTLASDTSVKAKLSVPDPAGPLDIQPAPEIKPA